MCTDLETRQVSRAAPDYDLKSGSVGFIAEAGGRENINRNKERSNQNPARSTPSCITRAANTGESRANKSTQR
jgi:hypothetical protein